MVERIQGRVVAVTGAARGIGRAIAEALLAQGARVAIGDLDLTLAEEVAAALGHGCRAYPLDVTSTASFTTFLDAVEADLGPLDVLVNNAGIMFVGDFLAMDEQTVDLQLAINLRGVLTGMRLAGARMRPRRSGHIVTIASLAGLVGAAGGTTYAATKHAVMGATSSLRGELRPHGVQVSAVCPSIVKTELAGGLGALTVPPVEPARVAAAVVRVLRTRRNVVTVPGWLTVVQAATSWLPSKAQEAVTRAMGAERALTQADPVSRAPYEERVRTSSTRDGTAA